MSRIALTTIAQQRVAHVLQPGRCAIDATVGNGYDTLFLAECLGSEGYLLGFDIQPEALENTRCRLQALAQLPKLNLCLASHSQMAEYLPRCWHQQVQAIMFNLGYLPGGDKRIVTQTGTTLAALQIASQLLTKTGVMTIAVYPGHPGGREEAEEVAHWAEQLSPIDFGVEQVCSESTQVTAPRLFVISRRG